MDENKDLTLFCAKVAIFPKDEIIPHKNEGSQSKIGSETIWG